MPPSPRWDELNKVSTLPILPLRLRGLTRQLCLPFCRKGIEAELRLYMEGLSENR